MLSFEKRGKRGKTEDANLPPSPTSVPNTSTEVYSVADQGYQHPQALHPSVLMLPEYQIPAWGGAVVDAENQRFSLACLFLFFETVFLCVTAQAALD